MENGKGDIKCRAFATFCHQKVLLLCANFFLKRGGIKFRFIKLQNSMRIVVVFTEFFSSDIEHRVSLSSKWVIVARQTLTLCFYFNFKKKKNNAKVS